MLKEEHPGALDSRVFVDYIRDLGQDVFPGFSWEESQSSGHLYVTGRSPDFFLRLDYDYSVRSVTVRFSWEIQLGLSKSTKHSWGDIIEMQSFDQLCHDLEKMFQRLRDMLIQRQSRVIRLLAKRTHVQSCSSTSKQGST